MELSARNQLRGRVKQVRTDGLIAEVVVDVGGLEVVSVNTRTSAEALKLEAGAEVTVVIKSTEVMLAR